MIRAALAVAALATLAAVAAVAPAACTTERQVLLDDTVLISCEQVWATGAAGDRCELDAQCARNNPDNPTCCVDYAYCLVGELAMDTTCDDECTTCEDDHGCAAGAAVCNGMLCETCETTDPSGTGCDECPPGWTYLTRNGCPTCECAPPSECDPSAPDTCPPDDPTGSQCYVGMRAASSACASDDTGCAVAACSAPGCSELSPVGCFTPCLETECAQCATDHCECDQATATWICEEICIDAYPLALNCVF